MSRVSTSTVILLSSLFILGLCVRSAGATEWGVVTPSEWAQGVPEVYPEANAIILRDSCAVAMVDPNGKGEKVRFEITRHRRTKVLTKAGVNLAGNDQFSCYEDANFTDLKAQTILPDGTVIPVPDSLFFEREVNDRRTRTFAYLQVDSGCVVEYTYTETGLAFFTLYPWTFGTGLYTLESTFSLQISGGFEYTYATSNIPDSSRMPEIRTEDITYQGKTSTYTWSVHNILPLLIEPYMSNINNYIPSIIVQMIRLRSNFWAGQYAKSWKTLGWAYGRDITDYCYTPSPFKKKVQEIVRSDKSDYEKSKTLFDHVAKSYDRTGREFVLSLVHKRLGDLIREKHGTGVEKNLLLCHMLKLAGIKAWPVLISTRDHGLLSPGVYRIDQFNHLIVFVEVEQGGIYLDASSPYCTYGLLPSQCRTEFGVIVDGEKSSLVRIITSEPLSLRADIARMYLDTEGNAVCSLTSVFTGYLAIDYGVEYERTDPETFIKDNYLNNPGFDYTLKDHSCVLDSLGRLLITAVVERPNASSIMREHLSTSVYQPMLGYNPFMKERRLFPIDFNYPLTYQNVVEIHVPDGFQAKALPEPIQLKIDGVTYTRVAQAIEGGAAWDCKIEIARPRFEVDEYPVLQELFEKMSSRSSEELVFSSES